MSARILALFAAFAIAATGHAIQPDPDYRETALRHSRPRMAGEKFDPQERDPKLRAAFAAADAAAERRVANAKRDQKFIFRFWSAKKDILLRQHSIEWKTPAELNPSIAYASYGQQQFTARESRDIARVIRRRTSSRITRIERDYTGKVRVWTDPGSPDESVAYVVRSREGDGRLWM